MTHHRFERGYWLLAGVSLLLLLLAACSDAPLVGPDGWCQEATDTVAADSVMVVSTRFCFGGVPH